MKGKCRYCEWFDPYEGTLTPTGRMTRMTTGVCKKMVPLEEIKKQYNLPFWVIEARGCRVVGSFTPNTFQDQTEICFAWEKRAKSG